MVSVKKFKKAQPPAPAQIEQVRTPAHYILVVSDSYDQAGNRVPAIDLAMWRIEHGVWGMYQSTRNRKSIAIGDKVVIYVGGTRSNSQSFVASATIIDIDEKQGRRRVNPDKVDDTAPATILGLGQIEVFAPKPIKGIFNSLSFIPRNPLKWGCCLMGGARAITLDDYRKIIEK